MIVGLPGAAASQWRGLSDEFQESAYITGTLPCLPGTHSGARRSNPSLLSTVSPGGGQTRRRRPATTEDHACAPLRKFQVVEFPRMLSVIPGVLASPGGEENHHIGRRLKRAALARAETNGVNTA